MPSLRAANQSGDWRAIRRIIMAKSILRGEFTLSAGGTSNILFQMRKTVLDPQGAYLVAGYLFDFMKSRDLHSVGGLELGAVPIIGALAVRAFDDAYPLNAFFIRKQRKAHGDQALIEGAVPPPGPVLLIDDVTTSGMSILTARSALDHNHTVTDAWSLLDREEGAAEYLATAGITLHSLFLKSDF